MEAILVAAAKVELRWWLTYVLCPIAAGLFCLAGLIIAKKPNAKDLFEKVTPYKGIVGVTVLAGAIWTAIADLKHVGDMMKVSKLIGINVLMVVFVLALVGFLLGAPQIAAWIPGESAAEKKGVELSQKLVKFEVPLGVLALATGALSLINYFKYFS